MSTQSCIRIRWERLHFSFSSYLEEKNSQNLAIFWRLGAMCPLRYTFASVRSRTKRQHRCAIFHFRRMTFFFVNSASRARRRSLSLNCVIPVDFHRRQSKRINLEGEIVARLCYHLYRESDPKSELRFKNGQRVETIGYLPWFWSVRRLP